MIDFDPERRRFFGVAANGAKALTGVALLAAAGCSTKSPDHYYPRVAALRVFPELGTVALVGGLLEKNPQIHDEEIRPFESEVTVQTGPTTDGKVAIQTVPFDTATGRTGTWEAGSSRTVEPRVLAGLLFAATRNASPQLYDGDVTSPAGNVWHGSVAVDPTRGDAISVRGEGGRALPATPELLAELALRSPVVFVDRIPHSTNAPQGPANYYLTAISGLGPQAPVQ